MILAASHCVDDIPSTATLFWCGRLAASDIFDMRPESIRSIAGDTACHLELPVTWICWLCKGRGKRKDASGLRYIMKSSHRRRRDQD